MGVCGAKWCLLGLLLVVSGLAQFSGAASKPDTAPPTVNECRVHVEAALKQYWSHSPDEEQSSADTKPKPETVSTADESDDESEDEANEPQHNEALKTTEPIEEEESDDEDQADEQQQPESEAKEDQEDQGDSDESDHELENETQDAAKDDEEEPDQNEESDKEDAESDDEEVPEETEEKEKKPQVEVEESDDEEDEKQKDEESDDDDDDKVKDDDKEEEDEKEAATAAEQEEEEEEESKSDADEKSDEEPEEQAEASDAEPDEESAAEESTQESDAETDEKANPEVGAGAGVEQGLPTQGPSSEESSSETKPEIVADKVEEATEEEESDSEDEAEAQQDTPVEEEEKEAEEEVVVKEERVIEVIQEPEADEDDDDEMPSKVLFVRTRQHIDDILGLDDIGTENDKDETFLIQSTLKDLKKSYDQAIKPLEGLYNYKGISTRVLGDAELFSKPMVLLIGPWSSGKSSIINYLLGVERTPSALKTAPEPTDTQFTVVTHGDKAEVVSGTEMAADWPYSTVQKFGQGFLNHFRGVRMPHRLLQKVTLVDTPGIIETRKQQDKGYPFNEAFQWFIDRADAIYITFDPAKLEIGSELEAVLDQLKGREAQIRFILNKADTIRRSDVMRVTGQLFWNLSPLLGSLEAPVIYTVSLMTKPFHPGSPARFLLEQEKAFLHDIKVTIDKRVENRIAYARRHAVRVRNHAKMIDCYLGTYYRHKSIFSNRKVVAESITENPNQYSIYAGLSALTNVSRYDLPDPDVYKVFFRLNPLYDFKPLTATCSFFKGCPLDKLDIAIAYDLPELLGKYKKRTKIQLTEWDEEKGR